MSKSMTLTVLAALVTNCGMQCRPLQAQSGDVERSGFPKACFFFAPQKVTSSELAEERAYSISFSEVYKQWCTPSHSSPEQRAAAVDSMVKRWKAVWRREDPYNAEFHETGASDLLCLLGLTHELPKSMAEDAELTKEWIEACEESCFTIWAVPENRTEEHRLAMQLWLRNDVIDHLKSEPASEPVIAMLQKAQYRLVD